MPVAQWPGVRFDATTKLAQTHRQVQLAIDPPGKYTLCDRCRAGLANGIYRLQRGHIEGTPSTWFICQACDQALIKWFMDGKPAPTLGGTEPDTSDTTSP